MTVFIAIRRPWVDKNQLDIREEPDQTKPDVWKEPNHEANSI